MCIVRCATVIIASAIFAGGAAVRVFTHPREQQPPAADCVTIGAPRPEQVFSYRYTDSTGAASTFSHQWLQFTPTGTEMRLIQTTAGGPGESVYRSSHHVTDDLFELERSEAAGTSAGAAFRNTVVYTPASMGDPAYRACAEKRWAVRAVSAAMSATPGGSATFTTDPGTIVILGVRESVTVPAGTFEAVRYVKRLRTARGDVVDEIWKSIAHGVTVRRNHAAPGVVATELLTSIK